MGIFNDLLQVLKGPTDEGFEEYESQLEAERETKASYDTSSRQSGRYSRDDGFADDDLGKKVHVSSEYGTSTYIEGRDDSKRLRIERPGGNKVVPLKTTNHGLKVCVMKPKTFDDSQDICDVILSNCCAIVTLSDIDLAMGQRIMDFISGSVYSLNGKLYQIYDCIFFIAPGNVDVSGDYDDILEQTGYNINLLKG